MNDEDRIESIDPESEVFEEYSTDGDGKESEQKSTESKGKHGYEGPTTVVEFPLKTEKWQEDMFEKKVFPAAAEFQNLMNRRAMEWFRGIEDSDCKFKASRRYPHDLRRIKWCKRRHAEIVGSGLPFAELCDDDKRFEFSYPMSVGEIAARMSMVESLYPNVGRKKNEPEWAYEGRINHACWRYCCSVLGDKDNHPVNGAYVERTKNTDRERKAAKFSKMGMESLAGNVFALDLAKNGKPFSFKGLNLGIARGVADRVWLSWQKKAAVGKKGFSDWGRRIMIDMDVKDVDSVKFQNGINFNHENAMSDMAFRLTFPGYADMSGKSGRVVEFRLENRKGDKRSWYLKEATKNFTLPVQEATIVRRPFGERYRYFVQFSVRGQTPDPKDMAPVAAGTVGIDIGPGGFAMWGETKDSAKKEFILQTEKEWKKVAELQQALDRSDRANNPDCYEEDGTIRKGAKIVHTKSGERIVMKLASLRRKIRERIKNEKGLMINRTVLPKGDRFVVERTNSSAWAKRRSVPVGPNGKKRQFGKSVGQFGPGEFIERLKRRAEQTGRTVVEASALVAATQFDPIRGDFTKHPVEERVVRWGENGEHEIDRDLAAAFNLAHLVPGAESASDKHVANYDVVRMRNDVRKLLEDQRILESEKKVEKRA